MDTKTGSPNQDNSPRKGAFDDLSRDELINKCKGLLAIAQKAKHSKTELQGEIESYKLQLEKSESEKKLSQDNVKTLQELVDSLTEQKLNYITDLDIAQNKIKALKSKCDTYNEEINRYKSDFLFKEQQHVEIAQKLSDLDSEVISLKRQNNRLTDENEQLINQLAELEASAAEFNNIGLQQREQLQMLEDKVHSDEVYKAKIKELSNTIKELENKVQASNSIDTNQQHIDLDNKLKEVTEQYETEKLKNEKANIKLRSYRDKILKCAACINQLKNSRYILTKTVKEYSEYIPKWQHDIMKASKVLDDQINELNKENTDLKAKLLLLEKHTMEAPNTKEMMSQVTEIRSENDKIKNEITDLQKQLQECTASYTAATNANSLLNSELNNLKVKIQDQESKEEEKHLLKTKINELQERVQDSAVTCENLTKLKDAFKSNIELLQKQLQDSVFNNTVIIEENKNLKQDLSNLQKQLEDSNIAHEKINKELAELKSVYMQIKEAQSQENIYQIESINAQLNELIKKDNELDNKNKELNAKIEELKIKNSELNQALHSKKESNEEVENLHLHIKALESEKRTLVKEKLNAKDSVVELESQNKVLSDQINNIRSEVQTLKTKLETLAHEKSSLEAKHKNDKEGEINNLKQQLKTIREEHDLLKKEYDNLQDLNGLLKEEVETLKLSLEQPNDGAENLSDLNVSLQADIVKLETKLAAYKQENASLLIEVKESRAKVKEFDNLVSEYEDMKAKVTGYKTENAELLHEMKEINQVLKERGESISKLQKAITEMERLIETLEKDRDNMTQEKEDLNKKVLALESELKNAQQNTSKSSEVADRISEERNKAIQDLTEKENVIASLKEEIEKLKQHQTTSGSELPNDDNMSTSTISKAEEHSRMKDLDETFEDKYTKLRLFALKLKKKLNETTTQLQNAEHDKARLEKLLNEQSNVEIKTVTPLGTDQVDNVPKVGEGDGLKSDKISELEMKVKKLTAAVESTEKITVELSNVKAELQSKTQELAAEIEAHKTTKENLEKARRDVKKKNVLSLEMEDYERSLKDLTTKMEESKKKMVQMESTIDTQEGTITAMKTQIKLLEEQVKAEETQTRLIKEELQNAIEESKDKDNMIQMKNNIITKLEQDLEDEKRKNEEADLETTSVLSEKEKVIMSLGEEKADLNNKLKKLEFKCAELGESLRITNIELADLKTEYTSYKVRAQAVLRQNQTVDHSQEEQLKEETAALRTQIETLNVKLTTVQEQLSEQSAEAEASKRRAAEAAGEAARAQQRTARLQADLARLGQQLESERTQHKLQVSTLTQCYKSQINELEAKLQKETESLRMQLEAAQDQSKTIRVGSLDEANQNQYMLPVIPKEDSDGEMDINVSMIPREEGEGSEAAPSPPLSKSFLTGGGSGRSPVPLERLLEEGVPEDEALDTSSLGLTPDQEISDLKRKLQAQQQRVKHVTVLLSESERECARMAQLAELLKAELRRARGLSAGAHNTEYMKNVTFKFLTLPPGDERSRLVPVIQQILTLTPEETQKVQAVAKGQDPNASKGWGSYLPWPGGK
ncbi:hypothetical protein O0L34_g8108 [Tuta absoluta]|nr:hypothetical protein O0L34_g8108 [Tuta absoluta]